MTNENIRKIWQNIVEYANKGLEHEGNSDPLWIDCANHINHELRQLRIAFRMEALWDYEQSQAVKEEE